MTKVEAFAPAKVNLTLHVTGQRADGYHLLDSLVVFAGVGDTVAVEAAPTTSLRVCGPMADGVPVDESNLVLRVADMLAHRPEAQITLIKHLPMAAGLGGGSSDAAAALRALADLSGQALPAAKEVAHLGADLPVCLDPCAQRMRGIGEDLSYVPALPRAWLLLVNPRQDCETRQVFKSLARKVNAGMAVPAGWSDITDFVEWLREQRNDLEAPAMSLVPVIGDVLEEIAATEACLLARMSGSGATCFGLYADEKAARGAAGAVLSRNPDWWVEAAPILVS